MMIRTLTIILLLLNLLLHGNRLTAQDSPAFSSDPATFGVQVEEVLKQAPARQRQAANILISNLKQGLNTGIIPLAFLEPMVQTANSMHTLNARPFALFFNYFSSVMVFTDRGYDAKTFVEWSEAVHKLATTRSEQQTLNFLENSLQFFTEGLIFKSNTVQWKAIGGNWSIIADSIFGFSINQATLRCYATRDSISIFNAAGIYLPLSREFRGNSGRINWERAGFAADEVFAELNAYTIPLNTSTYNVDTALLHFPAYLDRPIPGEITDRVVAGASPANATFPRFTSFNLFLEARNIFPGIDYRGGFSMEGNRILGFGRDRQSAELSISRNGKKMASFRSHSFVIRPDRLSAQRATFVLHMDGDSIYHPGLQMRYLDAERELILLRTGDALALSPYFNSYHQFDMRFEALYWKIDEDEMTFGAMRGLARESEATFESVNFFTQARFNRIQGMDAQHPLITIHSFTQKINSNTFFLEDLVTHLGLSPTQVNAMLISLANQGFVQYNSDQGHVVVKDRTRHYIDAVNNRSDYDVIRMESKVQGQINARLNLKNFDLEIAGVPEIYLSSTQKVFLFPTNGTISMKRGLDFLFAGEINVGYFRFYAEECSFDYNQFKLNLMQIDSMSFVVPIRDDRFPGRERLERVKTVISNIGGDILIDHPKNKSGTQMHPPYPIFNSTADSYVFFDLPFIQNNVYDRESFYYHILPFTIDSLNNFTTLGMSFNGYLHSGGIFPDIVEPLRVQPDFSLGFNMSLLDKGIDLYEGKAKAFIELSLSHQGLRGGGRIDYLTSVMKSDDFIFHPDSMMARLLEFDLRGVRGSISYPDLYAKEMDLKWIHGEDLLMIQHARNQALEMYSKQISYKGNYTLSPKGLVGSGELSYKNAVFKSRDFNFYNNAFASDSSSLAISSQAFGPAFLAEPYSFEFDLGIRQGRFSKTQHDALIEFPINSYIAFMDEFRWEADYEEIYLSHNDETQPFLPGSTSFASLSADDTFVRFISLSPEQDSLRFTAGNARFDLKEFNIEIQEVPFVEVADAAIFPVDGKVVVQRIGSLRPLQGANLIANKSSRHHKLYNVNATINSRSDYTATGTYDFIDSFDKTQAIFFNRIGPDENGQTSGIAHISDLGFSLSPFFDFIGDISFSANEKNFSADGGYRINQQCTPASPHWVKFQGTIDTGNLVLPVKAPPYDIHGREIAASLLFSPNLNKIYSGFLLNKESPADIALISASGSISFDPRSREYTIGQTDTLTADPKASKLKLHVDDCIISGQGAINFGEKLGQVKLSTAGNASYNILSDSTFLRVFAALDFFFDSQSLDMLNQSITEVALPGMDPTNELFRLGLNHLLNVAEAERLIAELNLYGTFRRYPRELSQTMILGDVNMIWNASSRSFTSTGPIGLMALNNQLVNRYIEGHVELIRRRTGDAINIYLQPSATEWYFFSYSAGIMQAISSNEDFNNRILNIREDRRTLKTRGDEEPYQFIISTVQMRNAFLRRLRGS